MYRIWTCMFAIQPGKWPLYQGKNHNSSTMMLSGTSCILVETAQQQLLDSVVLVTKNRHDLRIAWSDIYSSYIFWGGIFFKLADLETWLSPVLFFKVLIHPSEDTLLHDAALPTPPICRRLQDAHARRGRQAAPGAWSSPCVTHVFVLCVSCHLLWPATISTHAMYHHRLRTLYSPPSYVCWGPCCMDAPVT